MSWLDVCPGSRRGAAAESVQELQKKQYMKKNGATENENMNDSKLSAVVAMANFQQKETKVCRLLSEI
jgi:hypothetical protein